MDTCTPVHSRTRLLETIEAKDRQLCAQQNEIVALRKEIADKEAALVAKEYTTENIRSQISQVGGWEYVDLVLTCGTLSGYNKMSFVCSLLYCYSGTVQNLDSGVNCGLDHGLQLG